ncbi:MAG: AI-2E family transporter [Nitrospiraceae bacterium]
MEQHRQHERELATKAIRIGFAISLGALLIAVFSPFLSIIAWAAVLCYALHPLHKKVLRLTKGRKTGAALLMCLILTVGCLLPIASLSFLRLDELTKTYTIVATVIEKEEGLLEGGWRELPLVKPAIKRMEEYERITGKDLRATLANNLTEFGATLVQQITLVATNALLGLFELGFILLCAFFFFRDGADWVARVQALLPFSRKRQELVIQRFDDVVIGSIYGNAAVAIMVGIVGGLSFFATGLHGPVLWGTVMGMLAYLPVAGAALIWVPGALYWFFQGAYVEMAVICVAGAIIAFIDHVVRNLLVASRVQLHPLLVLFSVLGGLKLFGLLGLIAGPLVAALARTMLEDYGRVRQEEARSATTEHPS